MKREEAINLLGWLKSKTNRDDDLEAIDMAIEALSVVRCKDCIHQDHCYQTVSHTKIHDDFQEHWSETIEWCSRGERKGGGDK